LGLLLLLLLLLLPLLLLMMMMMKLLGLLLEVLRQLGRVLRRVLVKGAVLALGEGGAHVCVLIGEHQGALTAGKEQGGGRRVQGHGKLLGAKGAATWVVVV